MIRVEIAQSRRSTCWNDRNSMKYFRWILNKTINLHLRVISSKWQLKKLRSPHIYEIEQSEITLYTEIFNVGSTFTIYGYGDWPVLRTFLRAHWFTFIGHKIDQPFCDKNSKIKRKQQLKNTHLRHIYSFGATTIVLFIWETDDGS